MYYFDNLANNGIGDDGCEHLAKAKWKNLRYLEVISGGSRNIDSLVTFVGVNIMGKADWPLLVQLKLVNINSSKSKK
jgi:hypothetical protein